MLHEPGGANQRSAQQPCAQSIPITYDPVLLCDRVAGGVRSSLGERDAADAAPHRTSGALERRLREQNLLP